MLLDRDEFNRDQVEQMNQWTEADREDFLTRRDRERGLLDPIQEGVIARAAQGPDYAGAAGRSDADVAQSYGLLRDRMRRYNQKYGITPGSGRMLSENRKLGNQEALARVHGRSQSRLIEDDRDWARKIAALGTGNMRNASPNFRLDQLGVPSAAGALGNQANNYAASADASYGLAGTLMADTVDRMGDWSPSGGGSASTGWEDSGNWWGP